MKKVKMNVGDIVIDNNDRKWVIFDIDFPHIYVADFKNPKNADVLLPDYIKSVEAKPSNVSWLFIKRREDNLKGLERYK